MLATTLSKPSRFLFNSQEVALLAVLAAVHFTNVLDFMLVMPLGTRLMNELQIGSREFGYIVGAYSYAAAIAGLGLAAWVDRFDRKRVLVVLYAGFVLGTFLCAIAPNFTLLVLARIVTGAFGGVVAGVNLAIVGDAFAEGKRATAMGVVMGSFSVASVVGIPAGLWLAGEDGWRLPFAVLAVACLGVLALAVATLPELRGHLRRPTKSPLAGLVAIFTHPVQLGALAFSGILVMTTFCVVPYITPYMELNVGMPKDNVKWMYIVGGSVTFFSMPLVGRISDLFGKRPTFFFIAALLPVVLVAITQLPPVRTPVAIVAFTSFMVFTSARMPPAMAMVTACTVPETRGAFMSANAAVQHMALGIAASVSAELLSGGKTAPLVGYANVGWVAVALSCLTIILAIPLQSVRRGQVSVEPELAVETVGV